MILRVALALSVAAGCASAILAVAELPRGDTRSERAEAFICGARWAVWQSADRSHDYGHACDGELVNAYVHGHLLDLVREGKFP